jgi:hypothetical protein
MSDYMVLRGERTQAFALRDARGPGHQSRNMNTKFCCRCVQNRTTKGGRTLPGGLFECALHQANGEAPT